MSLFPYPESHTGNDQELRVLHSITNIMFESHSKPLSFSWLFKNVEIFSILILDPTHLGISDKMKQQTYEKLFEAKIENREPN